ncbi:hypothetical protein AB0G04_28560 [Actinoplanes sp. NPDC023801]|uniref:hypothetical protein n=1 Tax=Actinoplanes sp. NPDC023801 TaxID=3154595 RepID=UPI00340C2A92
MVAYDGAELDRLRMRVRAARRAGSAPMLVFGLTTLAFAVYDGLVGYHFVPMPLFWPLCSLTALLLLWPIARWRSRRSGVGEGRFTYRLAAAGLVTLLVAGNLLWFLPVLRMLLWPATVLTVLAVWQHNRRLAWWSGIIGGMMIMNWFADLFLLSGHYEPFYMGAGGVGLALAGLVERNHERSLD